MTSEPDHNNINTDSEAKTAPPRIRRLIEVSSFLFLFILLSAIFSFFMVGPDGLKFVPVALSVILRNLVLVGLVIFLLRREGEPLSLIGWTFRDISEEIRLGIVLFIPLFFGSGLLIKVLEAAGLSVSPTPVPLFLIPSGAGEFILSFIFIVVVAFSEEIIFRGYLIHRLQSITSSLSLAVLLSCVIFSLGHGYAGAAGAVTTGLIGLALAIIYIWRQSLVAPIVMHFLQDFVGIFLIVFQKHSE
ncbi:MAG TPA: type II CAAX endopeptidase family protein [Thermodesulfobacteriota bacterium]|nr:type II CAAX endopeptidase family protein [Thermodesulfobacteriota bacterium]